MPAEPEVAGQAFLIANNVNTTLLSAISSSATSITLLSSANLPTLLTGEIFALTLNDAATQTVFEVVYVTAITGAVLTCVRGQEGTTAQAWNAGDYAFGSATAGLLNQLYPVFQHNGMTYGATGHWIADFVNATSTSTTVTLTGAAVFQVNGTVFVFDATAVSITALPFTVTNSFTFTSVNGHTYIYFGYGS